MEHPTDPKVKHLFLTVHGVPYAKTAVPLVRFSLCVAPYLFSFLYVLQSRDSSQRHGQNVAQESTLDGIGVEGHWRATKPRMAALRDSPVRLVVCGFVLAGWRHSNEPSDFRFYKKTNLQTEQFIH